MTDYHCPYPRPRFTATRIHAAPPPPRTPRAPSPHAAARHATAAERRRPPPPGARAAAAARSLAPDGVRLEGEELGVQRLEQRLRERPRRQHDLRRVEHANERDATQAVARVLACDEAAHAAALRRDEAALGLAFGACAEEAPPSSSPITKFW